jgi:DNA-binding LytR/AlgR family response regulator
VTRRLCVLAVDDERPALDELAYLLARDDRVGEVRTAGDGSQALRELERDDVDAVFLDIRMPGLSGLDLAKVLARFARPPAIVFVTAYDQHAVAAFDLHALDYLVKPVRAERLAEAVRRVHDATADRLAAHDDGGGGTPASTSDDHDGEQGTIPVPAAGPAGAVRFLSRSEVAYAEAAGDYARLRTAAGSHLVRVPLATLAEEWAAAGFVRVHRSYLVNVRRIEELRFDGTHYTVLVAGHELPVSRRHSRELKDRLVRSARPGGG